MKTKLLGGGIIMTLIGAGALAVWQYSFQRRETDPFRRVGKYNVLWSALLILVFGISFILAVIFGE